MVHHRWLIEPLSKRPTTTMNRHDDWYILEEVEGFLLKHFALFFSIVNRVLTHKKLLCCTNPPPLPPLRFLALIHTLWCCPLRPQQVLPPATSHNLPHLPSTSALQHREYKVMHYSGNQIHHRQPQYYSTKNTESCITYVTKSTTHNPSTVAQRIQSHALLR